MIFIFFFFPDSHDYLNGKRGSELPYRINKAELLL